MNVDMSRRGFLGGLFGSVVIVGCRTALPDAPKPNLRLGVLADIHLCAEEGDFNKFGDAKVFRHALEWFRDQGVDGVVIAGDMADNGMISQLRRVARAWNAVFPGDRAPDGRHVEKLFVYGNHDLEGQRYDGFDKRFVFDKEAFRKGQIANDPAKAWEKVFGEPYAPIWMKTVKGYQFVGAHWVDGKWDGIAAVEPWFREHAAEIDTKKPFFFIQHPHPKDTCFGPDAWGHDAGYSTRALSAFPNAVAFSGHAHCPATDDRFVWQGAFTSIGVGSLRYGGSDCIRSAYGGQKIGFVNGGPRWRTRQGMLLDVYDTEMVLKCRDFHRNEFVRDDVVIPLPAAVEKPYAFGPRTAAAKPPAWPKGAALAMTREGDAVKLSFPSARGKVRVMCYEIEVAPATGGKRTLYAVAPGYDLARRRQPARVELAVSAKDVPDGAKVSVVAVNWFGKRSEAI